MIKYLEDLLAAVEDETIRQEVFELFEAERETFTGACGLELPYSLLPFNLRVMVDHKPLDSFNDWAKKLCDCQNFPLQVTEERIADLLRNHFAGTSIAKQDQSDEPEFLTQFLYAVHSSTRRADLSAEFNSDATLFFEDVAWEGRLIANENVRVPRSLIRSLGYIDETIENAYLERDKEEDNELEELINKLSKYDLGLEIDIQGKIQEIRFQTGQAYVELDDSKNRHFDIDYSRPFWEAYNGGPSITLLPLMTDSLDYDKTESTTLSLTAFLEGRFEDIAAARAIDRFRPLVESMLGILLEFASCNSADGVDLLYGLSGRSIFNDGLLSWFIANWNFHCDPLAG